MSADYPSLICHQDTTVFVQKLCNSEEQSVAPATPLPSPSFDLESLRLLNQAAPDSTIFQFGHNIYRCKANVIQLLCEVPKPLRRGVVSSSKAGEVLITRIDSQTGDTSTVLRSINQGVWQNIELPSSANLGSIGVTDEGQIYVSFEGAPLVIWLNTAAPHSADISWEKREIATSWWLRRSIDKKFRNDCFQDLTIKAGQISQLLEYDLLGGAGPMWITAPRSTWKARAKCLKIWKCSSPESFESGHFVIRSDGVASFARRTMNDNSIQFTTIKITGGNADNSNIESTLVRGSTLWVAISYPDSVEILTVNLQDGHQEKWRTLDMTVSSALFC